MGVTEHCCNGCDHIIGMGHSMGCAILAKVVPLAVRPNKFRRLVLVAPMLDYKSLNPHSRLLSLPMVGEALMQNLIIPKIKQRRVKRYGSIGLPELGERAVNEMEGKYNTKDDISFSDELLRMFRDGALGDQSDSYRLLSKHLNETNNISKVHVIWGSNDTVANEKQIIHILCTLGRMKCVDAISASSADSLEKNGVSYSKLHGLEHNLLLSQPKVCADEIVQFLNRTRLL